MKFNSCSQTSQKLVVSNLSLINTMRLVYECLEAWKPDNHIKRTNLTTYETLPDFGFVREVAKFREYDQRVLSGGLPYNP
jgi:hypothetical protein